MAQERRKSDRETVLTTAALVSVLLIVLILGGLPIFLALGVAGMAGLYLVRGVTTLSLAPTSFFGQLSSFEMIALPLFILMGHTLAATPIGRDLFVVASRWLGWLRGGIFEPEYVWSGADKVAALDDLNGKRCRVVSYEASTALEKFGVAPVRIPSSETYLALQRGTVDALVANISTVIGRSLQEQLQYCYKLPTTAYAISVYLLKDRWDGLDDATREAFWNAAKWYDENSAAHVNGEVYPNEYWPTVEQAGVEVIDPSAEDVQRFTAASQEIWTWWKEQVGEEVGQRAIDLALGKEA